MPPKKGKKKVDDVMVKLEKFDIEDFHPDSAANVKVEDTLVPKIFDWIPDDIDRKRVLKIQKNFFWIKILQVYFQD